MPRSLCLTLVAGPSLLRADVLDPTRLDSVCQRNMPEVQSASNTMLNVSDNNSLEDRTGESLTRARSSIADKLAVPVLLRTIFVDKVIRSIHPSERKIVQHDSPPRPVLLLYEARSAAKKDVLNKCREIEENLALFATLTWKYAKNLTAF